MNVKGLTIHDHSVHRKGISGKGWQWLGRVAPYVQILRRDFKGSPESLLLYSSLY
jgi:hypothetical protein